MKRIGKMTSDELFVLATRCKEEPLTPEEVREALLELALIKQRYPKRDNPHFDIVMNSVFIRNNDIL